MYSAIFNVLIVAIYLVFVSIRSDEPPFQGVNLQSWIEALATTLLNFVGTFTVILCNQHGNPATVAVISYVGFGYSLLFDLVFFDANFTPLEYVGVSITLAFSSLAALYKLFK